ncbi:DUF72 domain-containing protein, partial [Mitsuaria sp. TWR114]|uniref:DUF72 domain-containing protein n=1 Tax=Mitsuaria sp. TWR114 TaxID=2601731 RepID=UPI001C9AF61B
MPAGVHVAINALAHRHRGLERAPRRRRRLPAGGQPAQPLRRRAERDRDQHHLSRTHRADTFARWAAQTPAHFRFSVKLPRAMTHDARLKVPRAEVRAFVDSLAGLGE